MGTNNKSYGQGAKLLLIRDYLYEHTRMDNDKNHVAHIEDIQKHLLDNYDIKANRKTIISDIQRLRKEAKIPVITDRRRNGYVIDKPTFTAKELKQIVDSVQSSYFLPESHAKTFTKKIKGLTDAFTRKELDRTAIVANRVTSISENTMGQTDRLYEAIAANSTVKFNYFHYTINQEKRYSKNGEPYEVSPFAIYWNNSKAYLYAYLPEKQEFRFFRLDRMERISLPTGKPREGGKEFKDIIKSGAQGLQGDGVVFDMYKGPTSIVRLVCVNRLADAIKDRFPSTGMVIPLDKDHFQVSVKVQLSPPFYAWIATFGKQMRITSDKAAVEGMKEFLKKSLSNYESAEE